ncbi:unnamed protein product, partial [Ectocarpus fasciculatus]
MFSSSVIRRGRCSLARPPTATRCNAIAVDRGQPPTIGKGQQHAAIHRCLASATARAPPGRGGGVASGEGAAGKVQGSIAGCSGKKHSSSSVLGLRNEHQSFLSETTGGTVNWRQRASALRRGDYYSHSRRPGAASSALRSRALQAGGSCLRLDTRGFSTGQGPDGDHDGDDECDNYSGDDSESESECESESTLFGASGGAETAARAEEAGAVPAAVKGPPAKKNTKPRKPRNRRGGKGERNPSPTAAAQAVVAVADGEAETPAPSPEAAEAPAKKAPKAKTPRKRRGNQGERNSSPTAAAQAAAEVADGEAGTTATEAAAEPPPASKAPQAKAPRKRRGSQGRSARSPNAGPNDAERKGAADEAEAGTYPSVPEERKALFERARRVGVVRRIQEGGGVPRDSDSDSGSGSEVDSGGEGGEGGEGGVPDESPFPWKEAETPPFTWQEPDEPVAPKPFVAGSGADGEKGGAAAGAEAKGTGGGGKASSWAARGQRKKTQQQQQQQQQPQEEHPVLGHLVADLNYKRVYVTSVEALEKVPVWEEGRTLRPVHAVEIFEGKSIEAQKLEVRRVKEDGKEEKDDDLLTKRNQRYVLGVVDGQHRLRALKMLADAEMWDHSERNVVVEVFDAKDERDIEELYAEINRRERERERERERASPTPVQIDLDIPGPEEVYKCADEVVLHLYKV